MFASAILVQDSNIILTDHTPFLLPSCTRLMAELIFTKIDAKRLPTVKEARTSKREQKQRQKLEINNDNFLSG